MPETERLSLNRKLPTMHVGGRRQFHWLQRPKGGIDARVVRKESDDSKVKKICEEPIRLAYRFLPFFITLTTGKPSSEFGSSFLNHSRLILNPIFAAEIWL
jgi:hypothetical protein